MIAARLTDENGDTCVMLVLEPGNIEKLKAGEPIHKWLNEFMPELRMKIKLLFMYTPDAIWVAEEMQRRGMKPGGEADSLLEVLTESLTREPVLVRPRTAEELRRVL